MIQKLFRFTVMAERKQEAPLTGRKEEETQDKKRESSFAPVKVAEFSGVGAGMEHRFLQLRRLWTGVT